VSDHDVLIFLLALAAMLGSARLLGELGRLLGLPLVVGEIGAGILLGPTALGRIAPQAQGWLFPSGTPEAMIGAYTAVAVVLLLVVVGVEVDLGILRRRGRTALLTGLLGILLPMAGGVALGLVLPASDLVDPSRRTMVALLLGVALSISALPVIAKTLLDLGLFKSDVGLLVMAAAMIDDLVGWLALSLLLGPLRGGGIDLASFGKTVLLAAVFATALLLFVWLHVTNEGKAMRRHLKKLFEYGNHVLSVLVCLCSCLRIAPIDVARISGGRRKTAAQGAEADRSVRPNVYQKSLRRSVWKMHASTREANP